ncbi:hypothetical protein HMPREF1576_00752 [Gardnerella pickettii JCP7719]|uniref:Uncharacterized protein n=1 Tax=Gardnerella pickettii JCP7719 TaxID=1261061 RepID=S4H491_9BIFI|nr:hypothetical protein HMPREF1576_00752 [Gardnerella pickettii JCP7719]
MAILAVKMAVKMVETVSVAEDSTRVVSTKMVSIAAVSTKTVSIKMDSRRAVLRKTRIASLMAMVSAGLIAIIADLTEKIIAKIDIIAKISAIAIIDTITAITISAQIVVLSLIQRNRAIQDTRSLISIIAIIEIIAQSVAIASLTAQNAMIDALKIIVADSTRMASIRVALRRTILESAIQSHLSALKMDLVETRMELFLTHLKTRIQIGVRASQKCLRA